MIGESNYLPMLKGKNLPSTKSNALPLTHLILRIGNPADSYLITVLLCWKALQGYAIFLMQEKNSLLLSFNYYKE